MTNKRLIIALIVVAAIGLALFFYFNPLSFGSWARMDYSHPAFGVSFKYPEHWAVDPQGGAFQEVPLRFVGGDGYFGIDALAASSTTTFDDLLNQIVIQNPKTPYGTRPIIKSTVIDGFEARVVLPSEDQPKEANNEALFVARYPDELKIGDNLYRFFILYSHKDFLEDILRTLHFNTPQTDTEAATPATE